MRLAVIGQSTCLPLDLLQGLLVGWLMFPTKIAAEIPAETVVEIAAEIPVRVTDKSQASGAALQLLGLR